MNFIKTNVLAFWGKFKNNLTKPEVKAKLIALAIWALLVLVWALIVLIGFNAGDTWLHKFEWRFTIVFLGTVVIYEFYRTLQS